MNVLLIKPKLIFTKIVILLASQFGPVRGDNNDGASQIGAIPGGHLSGHSGATGVD